jgi:hypothetical protein
MPNRESYNSLIKNHCVMKLNLANCPIFEKREIKNSSGFNTIHMVRKDTLAVKRRLVVEEKSHYRKRTSRERKNEDTYAGIKVRG